MRQCYTPADSLELSTSRATCVALRSEPTPMRVRLDYGTDGLEVDLPDERVTVIEPVSATRGRRPARDAAAARCARRSTARRCGELVRAGQRVAISVCDITRAQPRREMLRGALRGDAGQSGPKTSRSSSPPARIAPTRRPSSSGCSARDILEPLPRHQPRQPRRRRRWRRVGTTSTGVPVLPESRRGSTPTSASRPASSSRTSLPASAAGRRWWRPGWPASRRC